MTVDKVLELGEQRYSGQKRSFRVGRADRLVTKDEVLELGEQRYRETKEEVYSWESRDISDRRRSFRVGRAEI